MKLSTKDIKTTKISKGNYNVEFDGESFNLHTYESNGIVQCWSLKKNGTEVASFSKKKNALLFLKTKNWYYTWI